MLGRPRDGNDVLRTFAELIMHAGRGVYVFLVKKVRARV